eukprot:469768_1
MSFSPSSEQKNIHYQHIGWTRKQGRILTCNGKANTFYSAKNGFPFQSNELPHHYLCSNSTHQIFSKWRDDNDQSHPMIICSVWKRTLFVGGFEYTTNNNETVWNLQTNTLFIDLRIPTSKQIVLSRLYNNKSVQSLNDLTNNELKLYARQHVFAGYTMNDKDINKQIICTRHHCMDWNFIGVPRQRPNKWYVEISNDGKYFKEWSYAKDGNYQSYYFETWQRAENISSDSMVLVLR